MLNVKDAVSANIFAMNCSERFNGAVYDVGTGENISLNEVKAIVQEYHPEVEFEYVAPREGDVLFTKADNESLKKIGWRTSVSIEDGVKECFCGLQ